MMDHISWDEYFMGVAILSSYRSKDPVTKVGACIVNDDKRIIGIGYNGFPYGCSDEVFPWGKQGEQLDTKYPYVVHAEPNAILNSTSSLKGATLYVTLFPCPMCASAIVQSRIKKIVIGANTKDLTNKQIVDLIFTDSLKKRKLEIVENVLEKECSLILKSFFKHQREKVNKKEK